MWLKKWLILGAMFFLCGCQLNPIIKNVGVVGVGEGKNGPIKVELFYQNDHLSHIELLQHSETPGFDKIMIELIDEVLRTQSLAIDAISGATESSVGLLEAIENGIEKSGIALKGINAHPVNETIESEILIVGGGGTGFVSAIEALMLGYDNVIIIEKMPFGGGNTRMSGGEFACANNYLQAQQGILDSKELFYNDVYEGGGKLAKPELVRLIVNHANENLDWLQHEIGVQYKDTLSWYGGHSVARTLWPEGDGAKYIDLLIQKALDLGAKVDYNTKAVSFIQDDLGKVIGVEAIHTNQIRRYVASDGVILSTGGFGANVEMRQLFDTQWHKLDESIPTTNSPAATGDGIVMANDIGANLIDMGYIQLYPINNPATGNYYYMDYARIISNAILVNEEGKRFVDEKETRDNIAKAIIKQMNSKAYELVSQRVIDELALDTAYQDELLRGIEQGVIVQGTLEQCANHFNIPLTDLKVTIDRYNEMARQGVDLDFGRTHQLEPMEDDRYLMFSSIVSVHYTMGGVEINEKAQVINQSGEIIDGLYAAGEVTGGIHGNNRLGTLSIPDTVTFGRIAAQSIYDKNQ